MKTDKQIFARVEKELPVRDQEQVFRDWSRYINNTTRLRRVLVSDAVLFEYNFWLTMNQERWFMDGLDLLLDSFNRAKAQNQNECFQAVVDSDFKINDGLRNMHRMFHLEGNKSVRRLDLFGKICFREIGDMIEGTLKPFMDLMLGMHRITIGPRKASAAQIDEMSLGAVVGELLASGKLEQLYQPSPWNVPLNQWRNVAQHYSFKVDNSQVALECAYGAKVKKTLSMDRDSLIALLEKIHAIAYVHKIAHLLFFLDNIDEMTSRVTIIPELSEDTIKSHVMTAILRNEFKLISLKSKRDWRITLRDEVLRSASDRRVALNHIAAAFKFVVRDLTLKMTVYYKDEKGEQTLKAIVK